MICLAGESPIDWTRKARLDKMCLNVVEYNVMSKNRGVSQQDITGETEQKLKLRKIKYESQNFSKNQMRKM
jgi:hypothetical protein